MSDFLDDLDVDPQKEEERRARIGRESALISRFLALKMTSRVYILVLFIMSGVVGAMEKVISAPFYALILYFFLLLAAEVFLDRKKVKTNRCTFEARRRAADFTYIRYYAYLFADVSGIFILALLQYSFIKNKFFSEGALPFLTYLPAYTAALCLIVYVVSRLSLREYTHPQ